MFDTTFSAGPLGQPITQIVAEVRVGGLAGLAAISGPGGQVSISQGFHAQERVRARIGKAPAFTLLSVPFGPSSHTATWRFASLTAQALPTVWHLGPVTASDLTSRFQPLPSAMAMGGVGFATNLPPSATYSGRLFCCWGYELTLVTLRKIRLRGLANSTTVVPLTLRLYFANAWNAFPGYPAWLVPEPSAAPLLLGGSAALLVVGRARRRAARRARGVSGG